MNQIRKQRLILISLMLMACGLAVGLTLFALRQNISLFYTPTQLSEFQTLPQYNLRLGGLVSKDSVKHIAEDLAVMFEVTDGQAQYPVIYKGILPNLFREGQGVIVQGTFNPAGIFIAEEVLAKHDENYRPPSIEKKIS
jgi:cytochrome c-type biogenesis protein CcmE